MAPTLPTSYPRTAGGLLATLDQVDAVDFRTVADDLVKLSHRLPGSNARNRGRIPGPAAVLARDLAAVFRQLPKVVVALRSMTAGAPAPSTEPLFVPDAADVHVVRNAGTGEPATDRDQVIVPWWPALPAAALDVGFSTFADVEDDQLVIRNCRCDFHGHVDRWAGSPCDDLIGYSRTISMVRSRDAGWHQFARNMRGGGRPAQAQPRQRARDTARTYHELVAQLEPLGDRLAAGVATYIETSWSLLAELLDQTEGDFTMPTITTPAVISNLAGRIRDAITSGHGGRLVVSDAETAFAWNPGPAVTLLSFLGTDTVDGRRTTVVTARNSATVIGPVAEGGLKSEVVDFTSEEVNLLKFPGQATLTIEAAQFTKNIETAVAAVMTGQIVRAIEADAATVMAAGAGITIAAAADITAGVLAAIAAIRGNGGSPNVVGLNSADWIEIMEATGASGYLNFSSPENGPAGTWLGLAPVIVPGLVAGSAIVADGRSATVSEPKGGPLAIVDPFTQAKNNKIVITVEAWAQTAVGSPGGIATVAVTATP